jgi:hypothetical protein
VQSQRKETTLNTSIFIQIILTILACTVLTSTASAEETPGSTNDLTAAPPAATPSEGSTSAVGRFFSEGEWYFSWGYSTETWAPSDIHVSQPSLGNDFTLHNVKGHDEPHFGSIISTEIFVPQYNIRVGRFIDDERTLAVELNLDHTKYTSTLGQTARVSGTINGKPIDENKVLNENYFRYNLHNGANHLMVNLVKRLPLIGKTNESLSLAGLGKIGVGIMLPHSDNTIMENGNQNEVGEKKFSNFFGTKHGWWQLDGWTTGVEAGVRLVLAKPVYLELTDKVAYAYLFDIPVYQGTAKQSLWMNEVILSLGFTYDGVKKGAKP